jgi:hypothetical protein
MEANNEMSTIKNIQARIDAKRRLVAKLQSEIAQLITKLHNNCDHSTTHLYRWEHDNGYGVQHYINGKRCSHCGFIDLWGRGHFLDPEDFTE